MSQQDSTVINFLAVRKFQELVFGLHGNESFSGHKHTNCIVDLITSLYT